MSEGVVAANRIITPGTVETNTNVHLRAVEQIDLTAGFTVQAGGTFTAEVRPAECTIPNFKPTTKPPKNISTSPNSEITVFPNPTSNQANIQYWLPETTLSKLALYRLDGQLVKTLQNEQERTSGWHQLRVDMADYPKGIYFIQLLTPQEQMHQKLVVQ